MWEDIIKNAPSKLDVINFMNSLARETLDKIDAKEGKESFDLTDGRGGSSLEGYYYTPNYVLEVTPLVGYHEGRGFVVEYPEAEKMTTSADWYDMWNYGFGKVINDIADKFGEEYRLKEEDKEVYPIITYIAGAYDYDRATFGLYCKQEDAWASALIEDIHKKIIEKYGKAEGKDMYKPEFPMAIKMDLAKFNELLKIEQERQLAMKELSENLGVDISFSESEIMKNALDAYSIHINKELSKEVETWMKSLFS